MLVSSFNHIRSEINDNSTDNSSIPPLTEEDFRLKIKFKNTNFRKLLANGELLHSVELKANKAKLIFNEKYNQDSNFPQIKKLFSYLCNTSAEFQEMFQVETQGDCIYLMLQENHNFKDGNAVLEALIKIANRKRLLVKEALAKGDLLEDVTIHGDVVTLNLKATYNHKAHYRSINTTLFNLYANSSGSQLFREKFECPTKKRTLNTLKLKEGHGFKNAKEVQHFLQSCAQIKKGQPVFADSTAPLEKNTSEIEDPFSDELLTWANQEIDKFILENMTAKIQQPSQFVSLTSYDLLFSKNNLMMPSKPSLLYTSEELPFDFENQIKLHQTDPVAKRKEIELELKEIDIELQRNAQRIREKMIPSKFVNTPLSEMPTEPARKIRKK